MIRRYALIADTDVFDVMHLDESNTIALKWAVAIQDGITFYNLKNNDDISSGYLYYENNFYLPNDTSYSTPVEHKINTDLYVTKYAGISNNKVIGIMKISMDEIGKEKYEMMIAGMDSEPQVVEITNNVLLGSIDVGWTYSNNTFSPPE